MHGRTSSLREGSQSLNSTEQMTVYGKIAFAAAFSIPFVLTIAYGGVDIWALIPLSLLTILAVAFLTADCLKSGFLNFSSSPLQLPVAALLALAGFQLLPLGGPGPADEILKIDVTSALSMDASATSYFAIRLLFLLFFFAFVLATLNGQKRIERTTLAVIIFGSLMAFIGILQRLASPDAIYGMRPTPQAIPFGPFVNQHHFAAFMELTIGLTLAMLISRSTKPDKKALYFIAMVLMSVAVAMTGSRGGLIGTLVVVGAVLAGSYFSGNELPAERRPAKVGPAIVIGLGLTVVVVATVVVFLSGIDPLVRGIGLQNDQSDPTSGRTHFWNIAWKIFLDHPIIGAGFDAFAVAFTKYDTWNGFFRVEQAHNDYLQILADGGILAFGCIAVFIFLFVRLSLKQFNSSELKRRTIAVGAFAGCCGMLVHSVFDFPLRTSSNSYFFLLLAVLATADVGGIKGRLRRKG